MGIWWRGLATRGPDFGSSQSRVRVPAALLNFLCVCLSKTLVVWELSFLIYKVGVMCAPAIGPLEIVNDMSLPPGDSVLSQDFPPPSSSCKNKWPPVQEQQSANPAVPGRSRDAKSLGP